MLVPITLLLTASLLLADDESLRGTTIFGEADRMAQRLADVDELLRTKEWAKAIHELQRLIDDHGEELVPGWVRTEGNARVDRRHLRQVRWLCHERLASLPREALGMYRARVDAEARALLDEGRRERDPRILRRLVERALCSSVGDAALDLLGDLTFERGAIVEAEHWWRLAAGLPGEATGRPPPELVFPDPKIDVAVTRAKQLLALLFRQDLGRFATVLEGFRKRHADAEGWLAGRAGKLVAILEAEAARQDALAPGDRDAWPTFAGDGSRFRLASLDGRVLRTLPQAPRIRLDTGERLPATAEEASETTSPIRGRPVPRGVESRLFATHPVVVGDHAFWADEHRVTAIPLQNGSAFHYTLAHVPAGPRRVELDTAHTLTAAEGRVYACLGTRPLMSTGLNPKGELPSGMLVCLEPDFAQRAFRERWQVKRPLIDGTAAVFEGAPLVERGRVYVALTRVSGERARSAIACYDAETGKPLWQQDTCETDEFKQGNRRVRHHLLTAAGGNVVHAAHSGAVVALDAETGRRIWAIRYPSRGPRFRDEQPSPRGLAPALAADGRVFIAPADYGRILCLHAESGRLLWESNPLEVVLLLGVVDERLLVISTSPYPCVRALQVTNGSDLRAQLFPEEDAGLVSIGRGLLTQETVLWPTTAGILVLDLETLRPRPDLLPGGNRFRGNLAVSGGRLLIADQHALTITGK